MHAYKVSILSKCCVCGVNAKWEVLNTYNSSYGHYCTKHADVQISKLKKIK